MANLPTNPLGRLVAQRLNDRNLKQDAFGQALGLKSPGYFNDMLHGKRPMSDDLAVRIAAKIDIPAEQLLLAAAATRCLAREADKNEVAQKADWTVARETYERLAAGRSKPSSAASRGYVSLQDFPNIGSGEWRVIVGDRRQSSAEHINDLVTFSLSAVDVMFLPSVRLPPTTSVLCDRLTYVEPVITDELFGQYNLLIIGSPAVSLACRDLLRDHTPTFSFNIGGSAYAGLKELEEDIPLRDRLDPKKLKIYAASHNSKIVTVRNSFRAGGFVDPIEWNGLRGHDSSQGKDYGIVALAENPWNKQHKATPRYVCLCAGVHGPGTAGSLKMLSDPEQFAGRPWGGVLEVTVPPSVAWPKRFDCLNPEWDTHEYRPEEYVRHMEQLISWKSKDERGTEACNLSERRLIKALEFARTLVAG